MRDLKSNIYFKVVSIVFIGMFLLIPTTMIEGLISERENTQKSTIKEVSSKWGDEQTIVGPFITIPYYKYISEKNKDSTTTVTQFREYIHILPAKLNVSGNIIPELRYRSIYEIVVYNSILDISGNFDISDIKMFDIPTKDIQFDKAVISVGINDLRGIEKQIELNWNNNSHSFNPGVVSNDVVSSGINSQIDISPEDSNNYNFNFKLDLKGSQLLYFTPVGKVTDVNINSTWNNPSFNGAFLPDSRNISQAGFSANWNVLHLNRNYPQMWIGSSYKINPSSFGIDLIQPVDNYQKSFRSIRYAILFIGLTFLVFFFIEVLQKVFIHPIQYILVGMALVIFYSLLLSISEHLKFNYAFIISAISTLLLIAGYVKAILKTNALTFLISGILLILYTFIFIIIQLQDYALLMGSIGIFLILGMVMFFSRKIDWYNLMPQKIKNTELI